jgi:hypothetical protein
MELNLSLAEVLARIEEQIGYHREQEAFHAGREAFHREQRTAHTAELEQLIRHSEAFRAAATATADLMARSLPAQPAATEPPSLTVERGRGRRLRLAGIVAQVVERKGPQERFGARSIAAELNELAGERLRGRVDERRVSVSLRWLAAKGRIFRVEEGRPYWEAQYVREQPAEEPVARSRRRPGTRLAKK